MRRFVIALLAALALFAMAANADAGRRSNTAPRTNGNGYWHKGYGWAGYGWYTPYGDYVGYDGYSTLGYGYRGYFGTGPGYLQPY